MPQWRVAHSQQRYNGTGSVVLDLYALDDEGEQIPGRHVTVSVAASDLVRILALPTQEQIEAAFWVLIGDAVPDGWDASSLSAIIEANTESGDANDSLTTHVNANMGGFPIEFTLT